LAEKGGEKPMKKYRITRSYTVEAEDKPEALKLLESNAAAYLEWQSIKEAGETKTGWGNTIRQQLTGNNKR
jgi:hypothetical protein